MKTKKKSIQSQRTKSYALVNTTETDENKTFDKQEKGLDQGEALRSTSNNKKSMDVDNPTPVSNSLRLLIQDKIDQYKLLITKYQNIGDKRQEALAQVGLMELQWVLGL